MIINQVIISQAINCERISNCFHPEWGEVYCGTSIVEQKLYGEKFSENLVG